MRRSDLVLAWLWLKGRLRLLTRTPRTTFFTFVFPLILLLLLDSLNSSNVAVPGGKVAFAQFFTPSIAIFALTAATYTAVIFGVATAREQGVIKRVRGTPLPMSVFLDSWLASAVLTGVSSVVLMFAIAVPVFGVHVRPTLLPAAVVTLFLGGVAIAAVGLAVASYVRRADSAPIVANLTLFPLLFVSGVFYPFESEPEWLQRIANLFPLSARRSTPASARTHREAASCCGISPRSWSGASAGRSSRRVASPGTRWTRWAARTVASRFPC
jgi:ABC-2 type transport system permease protein